MIWNPLMFIDPRFGRGYQSHNRLDPPWSLSLRLNQESCSQGYNYICIKHHITIRQHGTPIAVCTASQAGPLPTPVPPERTTSTMRETLDIEKNAKETAAVDAQGPVLYLSASRLPHVQLSTSAPTLPG